MIQQSLRIYACYNMDKPRGHYAKQNKPVTEGQILCDFTYIRYLKVKLIVVKNTILIAKGWG